MTCSLYHRKQELPKTERAHLQAQVSPFDYTSSSSPKTAEATLTPSTALLGHGVESSTLSKFSNILTESSSSDVRKNILLDIQDLLEYLRRVHKQTVSSYSGIFVRTRGTGGTKRRGDICHENDVRTFEQRCATKLKRCGDTTESKKPAPLGTQKRATQTQTNAHEHFKEYRQRCSNKLSKLQNTWRCCYTLLSTPSLIQGAH